MKVSKEIVFCVDYRDFENTVLEIYRRTYSFISDMECGNDTEHLFSNINGDIGPYDEEELIKWKDNKIPAFYLADSLLNDMCRNGHIEPGNYLILVCW